MLSETPPQRQDGILTAEEYQTLGLHGREVVVLSACDTGLGMLEYGQDVLSLEGGIQAAGGRTVVARL